LKAGFYSRRDSIRHDAIIASPEYQGAGLSGRIGMRPCEIYRLILFLTRRSGYFLHLLVEDALIIVNLGADDFEVIVQTIEVRLDLGTMFLQQFNPAR
jgi:hypothetical protein